MCVLTILLSAVSLHTDTTRVGTERNLVLLDSECSEHWRVNWCHCSWYSVETVLHKVLDVVGTDSLWMWWTIACCWKIRLDATHWYVFIHV